jgi:serine/threonine protein kinase
MSVASDSSAVSVEDGEGIPTVGSVVAGKYRIEHKLGKGGMGVVLAARHIQLGHLVAIKFIRHGGDVRGVVAARFLREARASAALRSENVARVHDVGTLDSGAPYIVMEHLEGMNLSKLIRRRAPLPVEEAVDLMLQACKGLAEAHSLGIVHRDVKPGNMFLAEQPDGSTILKILDFGISKTPKLVEGEEEADLTQSQMLLGSPKYLSPEQVRDAKNVDHRTDVWALGLVLYYMLSGRRPFEAETMSAVCVSIATDTPTPLIELRPDAPLALCGVVMRCLEKDRNERVQTAEDLAKAIAPFAGRQTLPSFDRIDFAPNSFPGPVVSGADASSSGLSGSGLSGGPLSQPHHPPMLVAPEFADNIKPAASSRMEDSRNVALAVNASRPALPVVWLQVGAAAVLGGALLFFLFGRTTDEPDADIGGIVSVAGSAQDAGARRSPSGTSAVPNPNTPAERTVLVPGSARPRPTTTKSTAKKPDFSSLLGANSLGTTQATLRLFDSVGGRQVIGVVPTGEVVMVKKVVGEWCLVTYVAKGKAVTGWTIRNLIQ